MVMFLVVATTLSTVLSLARGVGGPQGQVVPQQLHDQGAVLVAVLVESVQLSNSIIKCLERSIVSSDWLGLVLVIVTCFAN